jgi:murein DD-endopeptidase MepM/ murein hydrolase activator NlpD
LLGRIKIILSDLSKGVSLIIAPRGKGTTIAFNIPGRMAIALTVVLAVLIAGLAFSGYTYMRLAVLAVDLARLQRENAVLRLQNARIDEIRGELAEVARIRKQIESWAGVMPQESQVGTGEGEQAYVYVPMWPRRYSYEIMREAYRFRSSLLPDMAVPASGWVSRRFIDDEKGQIVHPGIDIVASTGTPVRAALDGEVTFAGWDDIYGNVVRIRHNDSVSTVYGHNDAVLVEEGEWVARGEVIARVGNTGRSTAPHLHFEVLKNGIAEDPELYVNLGHSKSLGD